MMLASPDFLRNGLRGQMVTGTALNNKRLCILDWPRSLGSSRGWKSPMKSIPETGQDQRKVASSDHA
jgi:hypothetical protein